jgi:hypothetical protein
LSLPTAAILIVFASDSGQHVEQYIVDRIEQTPGESGS